MDPALVFYPGYVAETVRKGRGYWKVYRRCKAILDEVLVAPDRWAYSDIAIAPPSATSSTRWTSTMPRAAAKRLWRANGATTRSAWRRRTRRQRSRRRGKGCYSAAARIASVTASTSSGAVLELENLAERVERRVGEEVRRHFHERRAG